MSRFECNGPADVCRSGTDLSAGGQYGLVHLGSVFHHHDSGGKSASFKVDFTIGATECRLKLSRYPICARHLSPESRCLSTTGTWSQNERLHSPSNRTVLVKQQCVSQTNSIGLPKAGTLSS